MATGSFLLQTEELIASVRCRVMHAMRQAHDALGVRVLTPHIAQRSGAPRIRVQPPAHMLLTIIQLLQNMLQHLLVKQTVHIQHATHILHRLTKHITLAIALAAYREVWVTESSEETPK